MLEAVLSYELITNWHEAGKASPNISITQYFMCVYLKICTLDMYSFLNTQQYEKESAAPF